MREELSLADLLSRWDLREELYLRRRSPLTPDERASVRAYRRFEVFVPPADRPTAYQAWLREHAT